LSEPHARAALMHGGIVWRLVRESINNNVVLVGPTDQVFIHGDVVRFDTNLECWDDKLTDEDVNLMVECTKSTQVCSSLDVTNTFSLKHRSS